MKSHVSLAGLAAVVIGIGLAVGCSSSSDDSANASDSGASADDDGGDTSSDGGSSTTDGGPKKDGGKGGGDSGGVPVGTASIIVDDARDFFVQGGSLYYAYGNVQKAGLDGSSPATVSGLTQADAIATDGSRLYGLVRNETAGTITSVPLAGGTAIEHAHNLANPNVLAVGADGYIYFDIGDDDPPHSLVRVATSATDGTPTTVGADVNGRNAFAIFAGGRTFSLDYGDPVPLGESRSTHLWAFDDLTGTSIASVSLSAVLSDGSIATDGTNVYVRGGSDLVSYPVSAGSGASATTIVSAADCAVDGADVEMSIAVDSDHVYAACNAADEVSYELREYSKTGTLQKILGSSPKVNYGWFYRLTIANGYAYWMSENSANQFPIYRAPI